MYAVIYIPMFWGHVGLRVVTFWYHFNAIVMSSEISRKGCYPLSLMLCVCEKSGQNRGAWWATVQGVTKSRTQLSD